MEIAEKFMGATFSLTGNDGAEFFEWVESFNYLGHVLHRTVEDWPVVFRNIGREITVWGHLGELLRR